MLYHALIVRLSPLGPNEPCARSEWWDDGREEGAASLSNRQVHNDCAATGAGAVMPPDSDIASFDDIVRLVDRFYGSVRVDEVLRPIFEGVVQTDWGRHLPKMYSFWQTVLFGVSGFQGNPLSIHRELARRVPLGVPEFERWLSLFHQSVDALFVGARAEQAKIRAVRIAAAMQQHILADRESASGA